MSLGMAETDAARTAKRVMARIACVEIFLLMRVGMWA